MWRLGEFIRTELDAKRLHVIMAQGNALATECKMRRAAKWMILNDKIKH
ncbi:hypothetical protein ATCR1_17402 [Agrobacterium tumefaciens CCNWGS0286]|nr:hypothetical protein ATCR1_17402 [Agrobacterium tumefaciens CCNWGS0286]